MIIRMAGIGLTGSGRGRLPVIALLLAVRDTRFHIITVVAGLETPCFVDIKNGGGQARTIFQVG